jgi:hypothetical protein
MVNILKFKPIKLEDCLIDQDSLNNILNCNFKNKILLRGRSGVGKTLICNLIKKTYPHVNIIENIQDFNINYSFVGTTTNLLLKNTIFDSIIDIIPLNHDELLKKLCLLINDEYKTKNILYNSINLFYPNINKILNHYFNEN